MTGIKTALKLHCLSIREFFCEKISVKGFNQIIFAYLCLTKILKCNFLKL